MSSRQRVAVLVDGCFWHECPDHRTRPVTNSRSKPTGYEIDETRGALEAQGWTVLRAWEHQEPSLVAERPADILTRMHSAVGQQPKSQAGQLAEPAISECSPPWSGPNRHLRFSADHCEIAIPPLHRLVPDDHARDHAGLRIGGLV